MWLYKPPWMQVTVALTSFFLFQILHARVQKFFPHHAEKVYFGVKGSCHYGTYYPRSNQRLSRAARYLVIRD